MKRKQNKDSVLAIRLTSDERKLLRFHAEKQGISVSQLVRNLSITTIK